MLSDIIIIDEPFIWVGSMKKTASIIELSKVTHQQLFLVGKNPEALMEFYQHINEGEVRKIDLLSKTSSYINMGSMDLLLVNLN